MGMLLNRHRELRDAESRRALVAAAQAEEAKRQADGAAAREQATESKAEPQAPSAAAPVERPIEPQRHQGKRR